MLYNSHSIAEVVMKAIVELKVEVICANVQGISGPPFQFSDEGGEIQAHIEI